MAEKISIFIFIDALGWEVSQRYGFLVDGSWARRPLETVFGYSSTCDPTFLTGKPPREHGHFSCFYYSPDTTPFAWYRPLGLLPAWITDRGRVRHLISKYAGRLHGYTGYFQLYAVPFRYLHYFDYSEKKSLFEAGGILNGQPTVFDHLRERSIPFTAALDTTVTEQSNVDAIIEALKTGANRFAYCYLPKLDAIMHRVGPEDDEAAAHVKWYEEQIKRIVDEARGSYEEVRAFVFSDHGMTPIHETCDIISRIDALGLRFGRDYVAMYDSTMARFWFMSTDAREKVQQTLSEAKQGRILTDEELQEFGVDFPDQKYGELFFLLNPGVLLCPSFMGRKPLAGMHGFDPHHKDSSAAFFSNVELQKPPRKLADLYDVMMSEALGGASPDIRSLP